MCYVHMNAYMWYHCVSGNYAHLNEPVRGKQVGPEASREGESCERATVAVMQCRGAAMNGQQQPDSKAHLSQDMALGDGHSSLVSRYGSQVVSCTNYIIFVISMLQITVISIK